MYFLHWGTDVSLVQVRNIDKKENSHTYLKKEKGESYQILHA